MHLSWRCTSEQRRHVLAAVQFRSGTADVEAVAVEAERRGRRCGRCRRRPRQWRSACGDRRPEVPPPPLRFFTQWEFNYVTAMAETIWPTDDLGPGARGAGVGNYIDGQLAGSWGQGHSFYLNGPFFQPRRPGHGWQIPMTPADVYRAFLPGFDVYSKTTYGNPYTSLTAGDADPGAHRPRRRARRAIQLGGLDRVRGSPTSSRCSARTCSKGCWPTRRTAGTRTWSAGSGSASPATRCVEETRTSKYIFTQASRTRTRRSLCRSAESGIRGTMNGGAARASRPANATKTGQMDMKMVGS